MNTEKYLDGIKENTPSFTEGSISKGNPLFYDQHGNNPNISTPSDKYNSTDLHRSSNQLPLTSSLGTPLPKPKTPVLNQLSTNYHDTKSTSRTFSSAIRVPPMTTPSINSVKTHDNIFSKTENTSRRRLTPTFDPLLAKIEQQQLALDASSAEAVDKLTQHMSKLNTQPSTAYQMEKMVKSLRSDYALVQVELEKEKTRRDEAEKRAQQETRAAQKAQLDIQRISEKLITAESQLDETRRALAQCRQEAQKSQDESEKRIRSESALRVKFEVEGEQYRKQISVLTEEKKGLDAKWQESYRESQEATSSLAKITHKLADVEKRAARSEIELNEEKKKTTLLSARIDELQTEKSAVVQKLADFNVLYERSQSKEKEKYLALDQQFYSSSHQLSNQTETMSQCTLNNNLLLRELTASQQSLKSLEKEVENEKSGRQQAEMKLALAQKEIRKWMDDYKQTTHALQQATLTLSQERQAFDELLSKEKKARMQMDEVLGETQKKLTKAESSTAPVDLSLADDTIRQWESKYQELSTQYSKVQSMLVKEFALRQLREEECDKLRTEASESHP